MSASHMVENYQDPILPWEKNKKQKHFDPLLGDHETFPQRHHYTPASNVALFLMCIPLLLIR